MDVPIPFVLIASIPGRTGKIPVPCANGALSPFPAFMRIGVVVLIQLRRQRRPHNPPVVRRRLVRPLWRLEQPWRSRSIHGM